MPNIVEQMPGLTSCKHCQLFVGDLTSQLFAPGFIRLPIARPWYLIRRQARRHIEHFSSVGMPAVGDRTGDPARDHEHALIKDA